MVWGLRGGHGSRFVNFPTVAARAWRLVRSPGTKLEGGHSPLGAMSIYRDAAVFVMTVGSRLFASTKEDCAGAASGLLGVNATSHWLNGYHKKIGQGGC